MLFWSFRNYVPYDRNQLGSYRRKYHIRSWFYFLSIRDFLVPSLWHTFQSCRHPSGGYQAINKNKIKSMVNYCHNNFLIHWSSYWSTYCVLSYRLGGRIHEKYCYFTSRNWPLPWKSICSWASWYFYIYFFDSQCQILKWS